MKAYIAGPMSGYTENNFPAFFKAEEFLVNKFPDGTILNPARLDMDVPEGELKWENCMRRDIKALVDMTDIVLLNGWEASRGACLENHIATALGFRRWFLCWETMELRGLHNHNSYI